MRYTFSALQGAERNNAMLRALRRPIRTALMWQVAATAGMALAALLMSGATAAVSAAGGGAVGIVAGLVAALVASLSSQRSPGSALGGALRAEAVRLGVGFTLAWIALANYPAVVVGVFLGAFIVTMLVFSMAFFVRNH